MCIEIYTSFIRRLESFGCSLEEIRWDLPQRMKLCGIYPGRNRLFYNQEFYFFFFFAGFFFFKKKGRAKGIDAVTIDMIPAMATSLVRSSTRFSTSRSDR